MRKAIEMPVEQVRELASIGCTQSELGRVFGLSQSQISRRLAREPFRSAWDGGRAEGDMSLRRKQHELAMSGDRVMLIWLGKNRLGQADKVESSVKDRPTAHVIYEAVWGGRHADDIGPGDSTLLIEGEVLEARGGDCHSLPASDED